MYYKGKEWFPVRLLSIGYIQPIEGFEDRLKLEFDLIKGRRF
jgi:hypothetical protein